MSVLPGQPPLPHAGPGALEALSGMGERSMRPRGGVSINTAVNRPDAGQGPKPKRPNEVLAPDHGRAPKRGGTLLVPIFLWTSELTGL